MLFIRTHLNSVNKPPYSVLWSSFDQKKKQLPLNRSEVGTEKNHHNITLPLEEATMKIDYWLKSEKDPTTKISNPWCTHTEAVFT